jgi:hypothetical protein
VNLHPKSPPEPPSHNSCRPLGDYPLREEGLRWRNRVLAPLYHVQAMLAHSLYALALMFPPKLALSLSHTHTGLTPAGTWRPRCRAAAGRTRPQRRVSTKASSLSLTHTPVSHLQVHGVHAAGQQLVARGRSVVVAPAVHQRLHAEALGRLQLQG